MEKNLLGKECYIFANIGNFNVFGENVKIGLCESSDELPTTKIGNSCTFANNIKIGNHVIIGNNVTIEHDVTILDGAEIGNNVTIKSGAVIGSLCKISNNCTVPVDLTLKAGHVFNGNEHSSIH